MVSEEGTTKQQVKQSRAIQLDRTVWRLARVKDEAVAERQNGDWAVRITHSYDRSTVIVFPERVAGNR
jgi:hypothetical protein